MPAPYFWSNTNVKFDKSDGATQVDITQYVTAINGFHLNAPTVDVTPAGQTWIRQLFGGILSGDTFTITGVYDDTATTGPDALFNDPGCINTTATGSPLNKTRTLLLTYGGTKTSQVETIITAYNRDPVKGQPTMYSVDLTPTGAVTET